MKEVEIKFRVEDLDALEAKLVAAGLELGEAVTQDDTSYAPEDWVRGSGALNIPFMRIRRQGEKNILTMKRPIKNQFDCIEHETEISDPDETHLLIEQIGFREDMHIVKTRRMGHLGDFEVCLDQVQDLGDYVELEVMIDDDKDRTSKQDLFELLEERENIQTFCQFTQEKPTVTNGGRDERIHTHRSDVFHLCNYQRRFYKPQKTHYFL